MNTESAIHLLEWYDRQARTMPWRMPPEASRRGMRTDPYHVWLSEVMLQQTQVATVAAYFRKFVENWPTVGDLARADTDDVMKAWAGLGYYSRARNLKKCAEVVAFELGGTFPQNPEDLRKLPGVGDYTSAAISAIAFNKQVPVVDGNVERVVTRLGEIDAPVPAAKPLVRAIVEQMVPPERPGDFAQAMMDLGATLCSPKRPSCLLCPLQGACGANASGNQERYPVKLTKPQKPQRKGAAYVAIDPVGRVFLVKRGENGMLGGMSGVPTTGWGVRQDGGTGTAQAPFAGEWQMAGKISHVFTHFSLELEVWVAPGITCAAQDGWWVEIEKLPGEALPTVMKKVIAAAIPQAFKSVRGISKP
ncbi:MAG: A/G-specific adenine glycosylase [Nitratireductor sp.]